MSHLIEEYAKACGVKVGNPNFQIKHASIPFEKYMVVFHGSCLADTYKYWEEVFWILKTTLNERGVGVVQILEKESQRIEGLDFYINPTLKQAGFIIKNSVCFAGVDSVYSYFATEFEVPQVCIFPHTHPNISGRIPNKGRETAYATLGGEFANKSFDPSENPQTINAILPEEVASSIVSANKWSDEIGVKTIFVGSRYGETCQDIIPSHPCSSINGRINVRMDICHNEAVLEEILKNNRVEATIDTPLHEDLICKEKIHTLNYLSHEFDFDFVQKVRKSGIKIHLICISEQHLAEQRVKFFDMDVLFEDLDKKILKNAATINQLEHKNPKVLSKKQIIIADKTFNNYLSALNSQELFLLDLDWLMLYYDKDERPNDITG